MGSGRHSTNGRLAVNDWKLIILHSRDSDLNIRLDIDADTKSEASQRTRHFDIPHSIYRGNHNG